MATATHYRDLICWQLSTRLRDELIPITERPYVKRRRKFCDQIEDSTRSAPSNIAEGFGRYHFLDKAKFYLNARGSLYELKSHLLIATELRFLKQSDAADLLQAIDQLALQLNNLINATRKLKRNETGD